MCDVAPVCLAAPPAGGAFVSPASAAAAHNGNSGQGATPRGQVRLLCNAKSKLHEELLSHNTNTARCLMRPPCVCVRERNAFSQWRVDG